MRRALELAPEDVDARIALGWILIGAGDLAGAADTWRPVVGETTNRKTLERMAELFEARGEPNVAARARAAAARPVP